MSKKISKKVRREVKRLQLKLASDLKTWINSQGFKKRFGIAMKIIFKKEW
jgi:ABC-type Na+ transport system ATPase subunit NatA